MRRVEVLGKGRSRGARRRGWRRGFESLGTWCEAVWCEDEVVIDIWWFDSCAVVLSCYQKDGTDGQNHF